MSTSADLDSLAAYDFELPSELIAAHPVQPRDAARMLVVHRASGKLEHRTFRDLPEYVGPSDVLVANNTRVLHARLLGRRLPEGTSWEPALPDSKLGGKVEVLLLEERAPLVWEAMYHAAARAKPGLRMVFRTPDGRGLVAEVVRGSLGSEQGTIEVKFERDPETSGAGRMPLPPYMDREAGDEDEEEYQTVYSREAGSAAAPTAGLHFTQELLSRLGALGAGWEEVTLHVGIGTFRPVKAERLDDHRMHEERWRIDEETARRLNGALAERRRLVAVGTTSVRTLESAWRPGERRLRAGMDRTRLFIRPGHHVFGPVGAMITNFHLPKSTLLMLVATFAGPELMREAYRVAIREKYRFYSYGDGMLIL